MSSIPKGYKKTEVGVIPEDWGMKKLGDFSSFQNGIGFYFYNAAKLFFCKVFKGYFPLPPLLESQKQRLFYAI